MYEYRCDERLGMLPFSFLKFFLSMGKNGVFFVKGNAKKVWRITRYDSKKSISKRGTEQLSLRSQQSIVATVEDSVLRTEMTGLESQEEDVPKRCRWVGWARSGLTVEMKKPGLLVSSRLSLPWPWAPRSRSSMKAARGLWLQEVPARCSWWSSLYLYHTLGWQKVPRRGGWPTRWTFPHNTLSQDTTRNQKQGSVLWGYWAGGLPCQHGGSGAFGARSPHCPRPFRK
jgi:hypothetical protein